MKRTVAAVLILGVLAASHSSFGQDRPSRRNGPRAGPTVDWSKVEHRVAWYGTLQLGRAAAKKTGRPILLVAGAPHCGGVPGVW